LKKIVHLASFNGNIGDNAHHNGFYKSFEEIHGPIDWVQCEIRQFYRSWQDKYFDEEFSSFVNSHDAMIVGGGNFFEICHDYSSTGCTIDFNERFLDGIKIPIFFNALGFDIHKGYSDINKKKFKFFFDNIIHKKDTLVSFRNDGSIKNFQRVYGHKHDSLHEIPDGGFFTRTVSSGTRDDMIGVNLACDMMEMRLTNKDYGTFLNELCGVFSSLVKEFGYKIRLFPHIASDFYIISDFIKKMPDKMMKYNIEVMPYVAGQGAEEEFFGKYRECKLVTGMRYHANVCAFGMGVRTVPLVTYPKLKETYHGLSADVLTVDACIDNFSECYLEKIISVFNSNYDNSLIVNDLVVKQKNIIEMFKF